MLLYDNLEDTIAKLQSTICMYDGKAVQVREVSYSDPEGKTPYTVVLKTKGGKQIICKLDDLKFEFRHFKLGYANQGSVTYWWYRRPLKQYRQGLRADQVANLYSKPDWYGGARWDYNGPICSMLEEQYPHIATCEEVLKTEKAHAMAFNRDFALSFDRLHGDMIIEHRGKMVGQTANFKTFKMLDEYKHLNEAFQEAIAI